MIEKSTLKKVLNSLSFGRNVYQNAITIDCINRELVFTVLTSDDYSAQYQIKMTVSSNDNWSAVVDLQELKETAKTIIEDEISLEYSPEGNSLRINGSLVTSIMSPSTISLLEIGQGRINRQVSIQSNALCSIVDKAKISLNKEYLDRHSPFRYFWLDDSKLITSDSHRLFIAQLNDWPLSDGVIAPGLQYLSNVKGFMDTHCSVYDFEIDDKRYLRIESGSVQITVQFVNTTIFPYQEVIPSKGMPITLSKKELESAVKRTKIKYDKDSPAWITFDGSKCIVSGNMDQTKITLSEIEARAPFKIAIKGEYLLSAIKICSRDTITLWIRDNSTPILVREEGFIWCCMPLAYDESEYPDEDNFQDISLDLNFSYWDKITEKPKIKKTRINWKAVAQEWERRALIAEARVKEVENILHSYGIET